MKNSLTIVSIIIIIVGISLVYLAGQNDGRNDLLDKIKTECQHAPTPVKTPSGDFILIRYYPL